MPGACRCSAAAESEFSRAVAPATWEPVKTEDSTEDCATDAEPFMLPASSSPLSACSAMLPIAPGRPPMPPPGTSANALARASKAAEEVPGSMPLGARPTTAATAPMAAASVASFAAVRLLSIALSPAAAATTTPRPTAASAGESVPPNGAPAPPPSRESSSAAPAAAASVLAGSAWGAGAAPSSSPASTRSPGVVELLEVTVVEGVALGTAGAGVGLVVRVTEGVDEGEGEGLAVPVAVGVPVPVAEGAPVREGEGVGELVQVLEGVGVGEAVALRLPWGPRVAAALGLGQLLGKADAVLAGVVLGGGGAEAEAVMQGVGGAEGGAGAVAVVRRVGRVEGVAGAVAQPVPLLPPPLLGVAPALCAEEDEAHGVAVGEAGAEREAEVLPLLLR